MHEITITKSIYHKDEIVNLSSDQINRFKKELRWTIEGVIGNPLVKSIKIIPWEEIIEEGEVSNAS